MIKLKCLGGAREVGRSCFLVDAGDKVMLDNGVKLTPHATEYPLPVGTNLKAAIISHAHLDHSGNLPHIFLKGSTMAYMTPPTLDLAKILWFDTLKIAGLEGMDANFTKDEIRRTERYTFGINYRKVVDISENSTMEFFDAGHILGSAITKLTFGDKTLVYTGDFKLEETRLHNPAELPKGKVDYLMIESTYGDREHGKRKDIEKQFVEEVQNTLDRGGTAVVAAFAVGRSQEIIDILDEYRIEADVYLDGMGQKAARVMMNYPKYLKKPKFAKRALEHARWVKRMEIRKKALKQPSVIVTTSGMLQGGPVQWYLSHLYRDKNSGLFLTGYQVEETPGRVLMETGKINIDGINLDLKMKLSKFDFSAHASKSELMKAIKKMSPEKVVLVHGDENVMEKMKKDVKNEGFDVYAPSQGDEISL